MSLPWGAKPVVLEPGSHWLTLNGLVCAHCADDGVNGCAAAASWRGDRLETLSGSPVQRGEPSTTHRRKFRVLNVVDDCSREDLESDVAFSIPGARVRDVLDSIAVVRGYPEVLVVDKGPEFRGRDVGAWACQHGVKIHFIDPGKPMQNAFVESFNDKMRSE